MRIILADDHRLVRAGLRLLLDACEGVRVVAEADDGLQALDLLDRVPADLLITDIQMPRLDGIALTRKARARHPHLAVVGLTIHNREDILERMRDAGALDVFSKDMAFSDLCRRLFALAPFPGSPPSDRTPPSHPTPAQ